jgi:hypothetical protein
MPIWAKRSSAAATPEASHAKQGYFPGGEADALDLASPQSVRGLDPLLFEGVITEEGAEGVMAEEIVVIVTPKGICVLQPCRYGLGGSVWRVVPCDV